MRYSVFVGLFFILANTLQAAEDNEEIPKGDPRPATPDDCGGMQSDWHIVVGPGGCQCESGYDEVGTWVITDSEDTENPNGIEYPMCEPDSNNDDNFTPIDDTTVGGSTGGGDTSTDTPPPLTAAQCQADFKSCARAAILSSRSCIAEAEAFIDPQINDLNTPCFGTPDWALWNTTKVPRFRPSYGLERITLDCNDIRIFENSRAGRACTTAFRLRAKEHCLKGQAGTNYGTGETTSSTRPPSSVSIGGTFKVTTSFTNSYGKSTNVSYSVSFQPHEGAYHGCVRAASAEGAKTCTKLRDACLLEAGETVNSELVDLSVPVPESDVAVASEAAAIIAHIDQEKLGLASASGSSGPLSQLRPTMLGGTQTRFYSVSRRRHESIPNYLDRLRFLAQLSKFLETANLNDEEETALLNALGQLQSGLQGAIDYDARVRSMATIRDAETGAIGLEGAEALAQAHDDRGGLFGEFSRQARSFSLWQDANMRGSLIPGLNDDVIRSFYTYVRAAPMRGRSSAQTIAEE